jgi:hypothetical protein
MTDQTKLFITDIHDALGDIVRAIGGPKEVGPAMKPEKPADEAAGWVKDCLNRNRREKFSPEQILWLLKQGRAAGCHEPIRWICNQAGYSAPEPIEEETELAKLLREYIELEARRTGLQPKIEELRAKLRIA